MQMCEIVDLFQQTFAFVCFFSVVKLLISSNPFPWNKTLLGKKHNTFSFLPGFTFHSPHWYSKDESLSEPNNWNLQGMNCSFSTKYETHHAELWIQQDTLSRCMKMKIKGRWLKGEGKKESWKWHFFTSSKIYKTILTAFITDAVQRDQINFTLMLLYNLYNSFGHPNVWGTLYFSDRLYSLVEEITFNLFSFIYGVICLWTVPDLSREKSGSNINLVSSRRNLKERAYMHQTEICV